MQAPAASSQPISIHSAGPLSWRATRASTMRPIWRGIHTPSSAMPASMQPDAA